MRTSHALLAIFLAISPFLVASSAAADSFRTLDREACQQPTLPPVDPGAGYFDEQAYREALRAARRRENACISDRRRARMRERRQSQLEGRMSPRLELTLGYDGALLFGGASSFGRFRSPSGLVGVSFRQHYLPRFGLHVLAASALGRGRFATGNFTSEPRQSKRVGPTFTGLAELGTLIGPFRDVYVLLAAQTRFIAPPREEVRFALEDGEERIVRWDARMFALGGRIGVGALLGWRHEYFIEMVGGWGAVLSEHARYITLGARVGRSFEL